MFKENKKQTDSEFFCIKKNLFYTFAAAYRKKYFNKTLAVLLISWKKKLSKGIKKICDYRYTKIQSEILISKNWKCYNSYKKYKNLKNKTIYIQKYWKQVRPFRKLLLKGKFIAKTLSPYIKKIYAAKTTAATRIQKFFKSFKTMKVYQPLIKKKLEESKHRLLLKRQSMLVQDRNRRKVAVKKIEM